ncbi:MAG: hypothetical protein KAR21_02470 [Spirochaetales bacterium]|nr:hypothetical protein [Spirochaetales bacterium]
MKKRMTIELSDKMNKEVENIVSHGEGSSKVEVIRNALALYVYAMKEAAEGYNLAVTQDGKNVMKEIVMTH